MQNNSTYLRDLAKTSWSVSWPMTIIMLFEFLTSIFCVYISGKLGKEAQATYGVAIQIYWAFIVVANALTVGIVSISSRLYTSEDQSEYNRAVISSLFAAGFFGLIISAAGFLLSNQILSILSVPQEIKELGTPFVRIFVLGLAFEYILINTNGILRSSKRIKQSLVTMGIVATINIVVSYIFTIKLGFGLKGIAIGFVSAVLTGSIINLGRIANFVDTSYKPAFEFVIRQFRIAWPMGLTQIIWQLGFLTLFIIIGALPENKIETMAALTAGLRIESAVFLPAFAFNMAAAVIIGNLLGQKKYEEAYHNGLVSTGLGVGVVIILALIVVTLTWWITPIFSDNVVVIRETRNYLYICMIIEPVLAFGSVLFGCLNGAGDTFGVLKIVAVSIWLVRIPLAYFTAITLGLGAKAIWVSMNVSVIVQAILAYRRYKSRKWIHISV